MKELSMRSRVAVFLLFALLGSVSLPLADTVIRYKTVAEGMPGMPGSAVDETSTLWLGDNKFRKDTAEQSFIVDMDAKKMFICRDAEKSCQTVDLPLDLEKLMPEGMRQMMKNMAEQMAMQVEVTPTDETREIAGYPAKLYRVKAHNEMGLESTLDLWMTDKVKFDVSGYKAMADALFSMQPVGAEWKKEVLAIDGFPVLQETTVKMMGNELKSREELVSVEEREAPPGTYAPPTGYAMKPFDFMEGFEAGPGR